MSFLSPREVLKDWINEAEASLPGFEKMRTYSRSDCVKEMAEGLVTKAKGVIKEGREVLEGDCSKTIRRFVMKTAEEKILDLQKRVAAALELGEDEDAELSEKRIIIMRAQIDQWEADDVMDAMLGV